MDLGEALQLVLQTEQPDPQGRMMQGEYLCEGFSGIPVEHPCHIVLATDGTDVSYQNVKRLRSLIHAELLSLDPGVSLHPVAPWSSVQDPDVWQAHSAAHCRRLLVLVGRGDVPLPPHSNLDDWMRRGDSPLALPVIPESGMGGLHEKLRPPFSICNAAFYKRDVADAMPSILSAVGLTSDEYRIFISYRRKDSQVLAEQLFDALTHEGFDVFLDRFRVPPAVDFQRRLTQELADKSLVLVIESLNFSESEWTRYEIQFAVKHRLGIVALQTPDGKDLPGIDSGSRRRLASSDYDSRTPQLLNQPTLNEVVLRIKNEHGRKLLWRRRILRDAMARALAAEGLRAQRLGPTGMIHVTADASTGGAMAGDYAICVTPRPPELKDFHDTHSRISASSRGLIVGPLGSQELARQQRLDWLGSTSGIPCFDEGRMTEVARAIKGGAL